MSETADPAALLAHADWLRALARRLVGSAAADDAVQDTYIAALRSPPDAALPARPWLGRVLRNVTRMGHREASRRTRREDLVAAAAPALAEAPDAAVQRVETFRALVDLVLALDEPLRTTLVRHYFDGDTLADLARRDGVPEGTVRWRHKQAIDQLRARLDARTGGDRRAWLASLAPLAAPPAHAAAATTISLGGLLVNKILIAAALAAVAGGVVAWRLVPATPAPAASSPAAGPRAAAAALADSRWGPSARAASADAPPDAAAPAHVRQLASVAERRLLAEQIAAAHARRIRARAAIARGDDSSTGDGAAALGSATMDHQTIRDAMREVLPFLGGCYDDAHTKLEIDHLAIHAHLTLTGDPDIGTIVDADPLVSDDDGQPVASSLDDCLRSTLQTLELPPLDDGDTLSVDYPLLFTDAPPPAEPPPR